LALYLASVRTSDVVKVHSLGFGEAELLEIIIHGDSKTSKVVGKKVSDLELPSGCKNRSNIQRRKNHFTK
jgi:trk system potassium uptake protein TrkA